MNGIKDRNNFKSDDFINYALTSQEYKNKVASWHFINKFAFLPELEQFTREAKEVLKLIDKRKNN